jgi:hypothetical protein
MPRAGEVSANARGTDEKDILGIGEELERGEFTDEFLVDLALEDKVELLQSFELREGGQLDPPVDRALDLGEYLLL